ncbi:MAG: DUF5829 family protein [Candidatus Acidiferrales bacterium]
MELITGAKKCSPPTRNEDYNYDALVPRARSYSVLAISMIALIAAHAEGRVGALANPVLIYLNHVYVVPDLDTYEAVAENHFLLDNFGASESRTTVRGDKTYTGIYFYGEHTYFELLEPPKSAETHESLSGVAFGVEKPGEIKGLAATLKKSGPSKIHLDSITRQTEGVDLSWFTMLSTEPELQKSKLSTWVMEYDSDFLSTWYPQFPPHGPNIRRSDILERYAAKINRSEQRERGLFQDIVRIHLALENSEVEEFRRRCEIYGYQTFKNGRETACKGPNIELEIQGFDGNRPPTRSGVTAVEFQLRRNKTDQKIFKLGANSVLELKDKTAMWRF